jgi:hypothetical protein
VLNQQIGEYLQAVRRREAARKRFAELTEVITEVAKLMADEQKSAAPGNPRVVHYHGFGMNGGYVEPHKWPTADAITKARQELATAVSQVEELWNQIPHDQRLGLTPPTAA